MTVPSLGYMNSHLESMITTKDLRNGARFFRCALQVNPFEYIIRYNKITKYNSEEKYNQAMVEACLENDIEVIAVTDHYQIKHSKTLLNVARKAGIIAFGGFEAVAKDGVHFLCLFDQKMDLSLESFLGSCGIHDLDQPSQTGSLDSVELLHESRRWGAVCIAAHATSKGGLLKILKGHSRINVWKSPNLNVCAIPGSVDEAPKHLIDILKNKNTEYKRTIPPAIINASDVNDPSDLKKKNTSCFIKMSHVSVEGLRQAFLDPESRIRLHSDPQPEMHSEFLSMAWKGGFLRDTSLYFNSNLNTIIGGRGSGKSTIIESIRFVLGLEPIGEDTRKAHRGVIHNVLRSGTKVSLVVQSYKPSKRLYTIERTVPNPPIVMDKDGNILHKSPMDVIPGVEVFGQHEISELAKIPEKLTFLLGRFVDHDPLMFWRKMKLKRELERSRKIIVSTQQEINSLEDRLTELPKLEENEKRFHDAGLQNKLKKKSLLIKEERIFSSLNDRLEKFQILHSEFVDVLPIDSTFVSSKAVEGLPNAEILCEIKNVLDTLSTRLINAASQFEEAVREAETLIAGTKNGWSIRRREVEEDYEKLLRELQQTKFDGSEFIKLRKQIEDLLPLKDRMNLLKRGMEVYKAQRQQQLMEWEDIKEREFRSIDRAANIVTTKLLKRVRVNVKMVGNLDPLENVIREVGGNLASALDRLRGLHQFSLIDFADRCREGQESLKKHYNFPTGAAERIAGANQDLFMRIEELELPTTTEIELNTAVDRRQEVWQTLAELSTGQKATAVLLLLLLDSDSPLVVDQPEDDLDNRFITDSIIPIMRQEKRRRQFIFSTHNANIPVLGDAEQILGLAAIGGAQEGHARIAPEHMGSIDSQPVRELVEEILEGGKYAFEMRRSKYGF